MSADIEKTSDGPVCSVCRGDLSGGFQVLVTAELYTQATVNTEGNIEFEDPRDAFDFDWELRDADCPHCGQHLAGWGHVR